MSTLSPTEKIVPIMHVVSVIIPTTLRRELKRAVLSVLAQELPPSISTEVIVVVDAQNPACDESQLRLDLGLRHKDKVLFTRGKEGGGKARNFGIQEATGDWVSFLDDDDEWLPEKLATQIRLAQGSEDSNTVIVSSRVLQRRAGGGDGVALPEKLIQRGQAVEDYLFLRRSASAKRPSLYTSTILLSNSLARAMPWDNELARHQDWDWLIRLSRHPSTQVLQSPHPLVIIWTGSTGSISAKNDWESSLLWFRKASTDWNPKTRSDFLAAQTLRYSLQARSLRGMRATLGYIIRNGRVPSISCLVIAAAGLIPRRLLEYLMLSSPKMRSSISRPPEI